MEELHGQLGYPPSIALNLKHPEHLKSHRVGPFSGYNLHTPWFYLMIASGHWLHSIPKTQDQEESLLNENKRA